jgi:hypothetical protein
MARGRKATGKAKKKRKKPSTIRATREKTKTVRKKPARKTLVQRASPKKQRTNATTAATKTTSTGPPARPVAAPPTPSLPAQPGPLEERVGVVTHYYSHPSVATLRLESGNLRIGDVIHIRGHTTDLSQHVESLEVNHTPVTAVGPNDDFGLKVGGQVREHDVVYKVRP